MPTIKHLLKELKILGANPSDVCISAKSYDAIINDVEDTDTNPEENPEDD